MTPKAREWCWTIAFGALGLLAVEAVVLGAFIGLGRWLGVDTVGR
jgi:hypothetical protein